jgi:hypothetical protein
MLVSNQRPLPCEDSVNACWKSLELAKLLQIAVFFRVHFALVFRRFTRVLHRCHGSCVSTRSGIVLGSSPNVNDHPEVWGCIAPRAVVALGVTAPTGALRVEYKRCTSYRSNTESALSK